MNNFYQSIKLGAHFRGNTKVKKQAQTENFKSLT